LAWVCTVPLGRPVEPDEYNQNAGSSPAVAAGDATGSTAPSRCAKSACPAASGLLGRDTHTSRTSCAALDIAADSAGNTDGDVNTSCERLCASM
jgi:hypothetical protein